MSEKLETKLGTVISVKEQSPSEAWEYAGQGYWYTGKLEKTGQVVRGFVRWDTTGRIWGDCEIAE